MDCERLAIKRLVCKAVCSKNKLISRYWIALTSIPDGII